MQVAVAGSSGLIGTALAHGLRASGHRVLRLERGEPAYPSSELAIRWDPHQRTIDASRLEGMDAVVNLCGRSIGAHRWTRSEKEALRSSRVEVTGFLAETLASLERPPPVLLNASAMGFYGDRGDEELTEASAAGTGFLAELCKLWEAATEPASAAGIRVVTLRTGHVLSGKGGLLDRLVKIFKLGLGGRLGSGRQWWSWISVDDQVGAMRFLIESDISGPVNLTSPNPVTNAEFTRVLAGVLRRPAVLPVPAFALRLLMGRELTDEVVLAGQKVRPRVLERAGYSFEHTDLEIALRTVLERPRSPV